MSRTCSWCPTPSWSAASSRPSASACRPAGPSRRGSRQRRPVWPDIEVNANTFKPECSQLKRINLFLILPPCFSRSVIFWKAKLPSGRFFGDLFWKPDHCVFATLPKTRSNAHFFHPRENSPTFVPSVFDEMGAKTETSFVEILKRSIFCRFQRFVSEPFCFERKF